MCHVSCGMCQFTRFIPGQPNGLQIPSDNVLPVFRGLPGFLFMLLSIHYKAWFGVLQSLRAPAI